MPYTERDLAALGDLSPETLRSWRRLGILHPKQYCGQPIYGDLDLRIVRLLRLSRERGLPMQALRSLLPEIRRFLSATLDSFSLLLTRDSVEPIQQPWDLAHQINGAAFPIAVVGLAELEGVSSGPTARQSINPLADSDP